ncbi:hypothetical protein [Flavobacterium acetivorans]|uniref:hypothetical protein n=1 Tax=Flavobacterium acetivorans TaxID=2893883 RepID=UPI001E58866A|nr:hypothetical protein [Flavobacterium sp. F-29]UFH34502.1 hypothetical protein LNP19_10405 [Flavobacterium sp. F-29]
MRLDASLNFNLSPLFKASFTAGVINVTDGSNVINRYYKVNSKGSNDAVQIDNQSLGLTPNIRLAEVIHRDLVQY